MSDDLRFVSTTPGRIDPERLAHALARADLKARLFGAPHESERVGRFAVLRRVGAGGMGVVYAAYDEQLDRRIALKLVHAGAHDPAAAARLKREAQALARLSHPNVVQVYEVGEARGQVYIAMEFVQGETLRAWQERAPRGWREVLAIYVQAGRGLAAAHAGGLVHRDFKPENVLVGDDGRPRVVDFGLARARAGGAGDKLEETGRNGHARWGMSEQEGLKRHAPLDMSSRSEDVPPVGDADGRGTSGASVEVSGARRDGADGRGASGASDATGLTGASVEVSGARRDGAGGRGASGASVEVSGARRDGADGRGASGASDAGPSTADGRGASGANDVAGVSASSGASRGGGDGRGASGASDVGASGASDVGASGLRAGVSASGLRAASLTASGAVVGTPAYMAPEQHEGGEADARSDVFCFCVALHEALHGTRPFVGATREEVHAAIVAGAITRGARDVPAWIDRAVTRGLQADPGARWPDMDALLVALGRDPTRMVRNLALALVVLAALVAAGVGLWRELEDRHARDVAQERARAAATVADLERTQAAGEARRLAAAAGEQAEDPTLRLLLAVEAVEAARERGEAPPVEAEQALLDALDAPRSERFARAEAAIVDALAESRDGRWLATGERAGAVALWSTAEPGAPRDVSEGTGAVRALVFAPDGARLAVARAGDRPRVLAVGPEGRLEEHVSWDISLADPRDLAWGAGEALVVRDGPQVFVLRPDQPPQAVGADGPALRRALWSPDGATLLTLGADGAPRLWPGGAGPGRALRLPPPAAKGATGLLAAEWRSDGAEIVIARADHTAAIVPLAGGPTRRLVGHTDEVYAAGFVAGGQGVVTVSRDGSARVWERDGSSERVELQGHEEALLGVQIGPDRNLLLGTPAGGEVWLWQLDVRGPPLRLRGHAGSVVAAGFSRDGARVLSASVDGSARRWRLADDPWLLRGHAAGIEHALFLADSRTVITAGLDGTARVWPRDGRASTRLGGHREGGSVALAPSRDGARLLTAGSDGRLRVWSLEGGEPVPTASLDRGRATAFLDARWSPNAALAAVAGEDGRVHVVGFPTSGPPALSELTVHSGPVRVLQFLPDGTALASAGDDGTIHVTPLPEEDVPGDSSQSGRKGHVAGDMSHESGANSPGGHAPEGSSHEGAERARDGDVPSDSLGGVEQPRDGDGPQDSLGGAEQPRDGHGPSDSLGSAEQPGGDVPPDSRAGGAERSRGGHVSQDSPAGGSGGAEPAGDGSVPKDGLADTAAGPGTAPRGPGAPVPRAILGGHTGPVRALAVDASGERLASAGDDAIVRVWSLARPEEAPLELRGHTGAVAQIQLRPDGRAALTASADGTACEWSLVGGEPVVLRGHTDAVWVAVYSHDGAAILTASADGTARLWTRTSAGFTSLRLPHTPASGPGEPDHTLWSGAFSPDGRLVVTAGADGLARVFPVTLADRLAEACARAGRDLTAEEWARYLGERAYRKTCSERHVR